jgi:hypothetical protein
MMKSKEKGSIYFILDEYKPKTDPVATQQYNDNKYQTSNSPEHPNGIDAYNHEFTTDKERQAMDEEAMQGIEF